VVMIGDENNDDSVSECTYSQKHIPIKFQPKPTAWLLLGTVTEELKLTNRYSLVSLDRPQPTGQVGKRYGQIVISPFPFPVMSQGGCEV
jgi:hypothetical protein